MLKLMMRVETRKDGQGSDARRPRDAIGGNLVAVRPSCSNPRSPSFLLFAPFSHFPNHSNPQPEGRAFPNDAANVVMTSNTSSNPSVSPSIHPSIYLDERPLIVDPSSLLLPELDRVSERTRLTSFLHDLSGVI